jgi:hypothetical protein
MIKTEDRRERLWMEGWRDGLKEGRLEGKTTRRGGWREKPRGGGDC